MSLATKYRPRTWEDVTEQSVVVNIFQKMCQDSVLTNRNFLLIGPSGCGKAQPLYSSVLTPQGFISMRDVHVGTKVITGNGNIATVSGVYPQGVRPIYEIRLQDGCTIRVSDEHLNVFYRYNEDSKRRENFCMTTTNLIQFLESSRFPLRIDVPSVEWDDAELPIDPYLLGALIGDGSLSNNFSFSNDESDIIDKVDNILRRDWKMHLKKVPGDNVDYQIVFEDSVDHKYTFEFDGKQFDSIQSIQSYLVGLGYPKFDAETIVRLSQNSATSIQRQYPELTNNIQCAVMSNYSHSVGETTLQQTLDKLGLLCKSVDKHIPKQYLYSSRKQRLSLLQGLFDTDGYTDAEGSTTFTTCSKRLSDDFAFLVRSLGIRDTITSHPAMYKHNGIRKFTGSTAYDHYIKVPNHIYCASSIKHLSRRRQRQNPPMRNIVSISYIGDEACQCIMVDAPEHTYISDGFIPTHNTTLARIAANVLNAGQGEPIEVDAASHSGVDAMREIVQQARAYPVGCSWKVFIIDECHSISSAGWQVMLKTIEEGPAKSVFMFCTTNPEKIPPTILSRVQTFQLSKISLTGIYNRLIHVIDLENAEGAGITYTEDAIRYIAKLANGGMRDSLTLLDKALVYSKDITTEKLVSALNLPSYDMYFKMLSACARKDNAAIASIVDEVYNSGINFVKWFEGFLSFVMNVVKYILMQDIEATMIPTYYAEKMAPYGTAHLSVCLKLANRLVMLNHELRTTQYLQELALAYLCTTPKK